MQGYFASLTIVLLLSMVLTRVFVMKKQGIKVAHLGNIDKKDFLIPPFALFYFYSVFADTFHWPFFKEQLFFHSDMLAWLGVLMCGAALIIIFLSLISFGKSFRIGIDLDHSDKLITTGTFAFSRNPIYVAFGFILLGQFLIFSTLLHLIYLGGGVWLFRRQILREEEFLRTHYGEDYLAYCKRVRRYL